MALHDDVLALRDALTAAGVPLVPEELQGVSRAKMADVLSQVALGGNADIVDGVYALLDDETPSWFAKALAGTKVADGATTAHLAQQEEPPQRQPYPLTGSLVTILSSCPRNRQRLTAPG